MLVQTLVLSNQSDRQSFENTVEALRRAAYGEQYTRIAFTGRTKQGSAGVALDIITGAVSGHKIEPIPKQFLDYVLHIGRDQVREGLLILAQGGDVLIGDLSCGVLVRWVGPGLEIFGAGKDSA